MSRTAALALSVLLALVTATASSEPATASVVARAHASLPVLEREVMCVTCKIPLELAQSPQAERERVFISSLINAGESEPQIKRALVAQYGSAVLALPSSHGFGLAAYVVPLAVLVAVLALLAVLLPRWRRAGARGAPAADAEPVKMSATDAARVAADLSRFD